jgi:hypothetical protein
MYRQTDPKVNPIHNYGCYYISILYIDEEVSGKVLAPNDIVKVWFKNWNEGDMDVETTILDPNGLCEDLSGKLEFMGKYPATYMPAGNEREILRFVHPTTGMVHFVVGDGKGKCKFDPFENSRTVREGKVESKRIFRIKA